MKQKQPQNLFAVALLGLSIVLSMSLTACSQSQQGGDATLSGPGFEVKKHDGLFGSHKTEYKDALGNKFVKEKDWFGNETTKGSLLGDKN